MCLYTEFLAQKFKSPGSVKNYISGVRLLHKLLQLDDSGVTSFDLNLMLRAVSLTLRHFPKRKLPITIDMLKKICVTCQVLGPIGKVLKCAFIIAFFGMLRQSNLAPHTPFDFDYSRHTCRGDIIVQPPHLFLLIKWSKTLQTPQGLPLIPLPHLPGHVLDPLSAFQDMISVAPHRTPNDPLLLLPQQGPHATPRILTVPILRGCFTDIISSLGYDATRHSLHGLRRGGASAAHSAGVPATDIKRHGTWKSDAFWDYIVTNDIYDSNVNSGFQSLCS